MVTARDLAVSYTNATSSALTGSAGFREDKRLNMREARKPEKPRIVPAAIRAVGEDPTSSATITAAAHVRFTIGITILGREDIEIGGLKLTRRLSRPRQSSPKKTARSVAGSPWWTVARRESDTSLFPVARIFRHRSTSSHVAKVASKPP